MSIEDIKNNNLERKDTETDQERNELSETESSIKQALAIIEATNVYEQTYLRNLRLVIFGEDKQFLFENNTLNRTELNAQNERNCTVEDFCRENHSLSFVVAPLLEQEYPDFNQRLDIFWKNLPPKKT